MRLLILSSSTGGGHDMRARSLAAWAARMNRDQTDTTVIEVARYQALEESSGLYRVGVFLYNWIQKKWPLLHHLYFNFLELFQISASRHTLLGKKNFAERLRSFQPDAIVSVHAHTNHAFREFAQEVLPGLRFVTYCGEMHGGYGFSRHWVDPGANAFIGATPEICDAARQLGMPAARTIYGGFLLDPNFYLRPLAPDERAAWRRDQLGLDPDRFTLLLSTGANGALNHLKFLKALDRSGLKLQIVALCGRNAPAREEIDAWASQQNQLTIRTLGYQEAMFPLMQSVDGIVARPGTGTTSEAILAGCPIYQNALGGIMPQEWITVKYLRAQGVAAPLIRRADDLVPMLRPHLHSDAAQQEARAKLAALRPEPEPPDILRALRRSLSLEFKLK